MKPFNPSQVLHCAVLFACMCCMTACDTPYTLWKADTQYCIFRFKDTRYIEYALVDSVYDEQAGRSVLKLPTTGYRQRDRFFLTDMEDYVFHKRPMPPCVIAQAKSIYYPLHDGYFLCFPYNRLATGHYLSTCKWSDLCDVNMDTVHVWLPASEVFDNIRGFGGDLAGNYLKKRVERLTLEDVVRYANLWIDNNTDDPDMWLSPDGSVGEYEMSEIREGL